MASVVSVNISERKGEAKRPVESIELRLRHGIVGDAHAGDWHRQVSLLSQGCRNYCGKSCYSARTQAGGLLVDLDGGGVAVHGEDLADEALLTHADHVGHIGVFQARGYHQRSRNLDNLSAQIYRPSFSSGQAVHPSPRRRRQDSFARLPLLSPTKSRGFAGGPILKIGGGSRRTSYKMSAPTARSTDFFTLSMPMPRLPLLPGIRMMAGVRSSL